MTTFLTGATGYLGSYVCHLLLREQEEPLALLVRASDRDEAEEKLWKAWQLHMDAERFWQAMSRVELVHGDLTAPRLGLEPARYHDIAQRIDSVLHIAASLNRKSEKACLNTNLRGTLSVLKLARAAADNGGLRRYSHVSTVAVAGQRSHELVTEDEAIEWSRSDYDPYGRTKKFCEHMARELLPDVPLTFFRPSTVMGDSRFPETTQFDMVRALCLLADMPAVPMDSEARLDFVNADFVGEAIARLHTKPRPNHDIYHLSAGTSSRTAGEVAEAVFARGSGNRGRPPRFLPSLEGSFKRSVDVLASSQRRNMATYAGSLLKVFWPYITYDTVFDNTRVTRELGIEPVPFTHYIADLYRWAKDVGFEYPYEPLPARPAALFESPRTQRSQPDPFEERM